MDVGDRLRMLAPTNLDDVHDVTVLGFHPNPQFDRVQVRMDNGQTVWCSPKRLIRRTV